MNFGKEERKKKGSPQPQPKAYQIFIKIPARFKGGTKQKLSKH